MTDNIMFYPAIVLMIVEAAALVFLIWAWFDAKRRAKYAVCVNRDLCGINPDSDVDPAVCDRRGENI